MKEEKTLTPQSETDKAIYEQILDEQLGRFPIIFDAKTESIKKFSIEAENQVSALLSKLKTDLEKL